MLVDGSGSRGGGGGDPDADPDADPELLGAGAEPQVAGTAGLALSKVLRPARSCARGQRRPPPPPGRQPGRQPLKLDVYSATQWRGQNPTGEGEEGRRTGEKGEM